MKGVLVFFILYHCVPVYYNSLLKEGYLAQALVPHPLLLFGLPFSVRVYVLVTSLSPLRAYLHSEGVVYHRYDYQKRYEKVSYL